MESPSNTRTELTEKLLALSQTANTETALFHQLAAEAYGLGVTDMKTLSILLQEGPMTAGQLAQRLSLTTGAVTNVIDRLMKREVVERKVDERDRRKVIVTPNYAKISSQPNVYESMGVAFASLLQTYTPEQLEFLVTFHESVIALTKNEITKLAQLPDMGHKGIPGKRS